MAVENLTLAPFYSADRNPYNYAKFEQIGRDLQTEWLSLDEITQQLNLVDDESQDGYLRSLDLATRMALEDYLGFSFFNTQYRVYYGNSGLYNTALFLDLPEVTPRTKYSNVGIVIDSVGYWANNNSAPVFTKLAADGYYYDPTGNRIVVTSMPETISQTMANPIEAVYTLQANTMSQYPVIKQAGLLLLTHLYNNRSETLQGGLAKIPFGVDQLLRPYKPLVM